MSQQAKEKAVSSIYLHAPLKRALNQCKGFAELAEPGSIGTCIGPSGAGKSVLATMLGPEVYGKRDSWQSGTTPYVVVTADNPDRGYFSPKELTRSILSELDDPFRTPPWQLEAKGLERRLAEAVQIAGVSSLRNCTEPMMRAVIESIGPQKRLSLIIVDEANMLALSTRNRVPTDYVEGLRILGKKAGCKVLLFGTVDLLLLGGYSAQFNRSEIRIHLNRMCCDDKAGREEFASFLVKMSEKWNVDPSVVVKNVADMYDWTYGVPGEVEKRLRLAAIRSVGSSKAITWDDIRSSRPSREEMDRIRMVADIVQSVMDDVPLTVQQAKAIRRKRHPSMGPKRVNAGAVA